jgi:mRNA interferase MazF
VGGCGFRKVVVAPIRGDVWTASGPGYAGKPRPAVIIQSDRFLATDSVTIMPFTNDPAEAPLFRLPVTPDAQNGLRAGCSLMVDKVMTIPRSNLGKRFGRLGDSDILRLNRAAVVFLGLA